MPSDDRYPTATWSSTFWVAHPSIVYQPADGVHGFPFPRCWRCRSASSVV
jgi:hypothetical protein